MSLTEYAALAVSRAAFYPSVLYNRVRCVVQDDWCWYNEIEEKLWLGALPLQTHLSELRQLHGVEAVVTLNHVRLRTCVCMHLCLVLWPRPWSWRCTEWVDRVGACALQAQSAGPCLCLPHRAQVGLRSPHLPVGPDAPTPPLAAPNLSPALACTHNNEICLGQRPPSTLNSNPTLTLPTLRSNHHHHPRISSCL